MNEKFTPKQLLSMTMPFVLAKLVLRAVAILISAGLLALGISLAMSRPALGITLVLITLLASSTIYFVIVRLFGYIVRVGHIAVLTETIKTGSLPENQISYGTSKVKERIASAFVFFAINKLVDRAVWQLQGRIGVAATFLFGIPGMGKIAAFVQTFVKMALKFVDECCVAWIFYGPEEQSAWKGALDGVVIYAQNWKKILKEALKTTVIFLLLAFGIGIILVLIFSAILDILVSFWGFLVLFLSVLIAFAIKNAFLDSYIMIRTLVPFLEVAPDTEIRVDLYSKFSGMSEAFRTLTDRAREDSNGEFMTPPMAATNPNVPPRGSASLKDIFCGECGTKNPSGTAFCGECGSKL